MVMGSYVWKQKEMNMRCENAKTYDNLRKEVGSNSPSKSKQRVCNLDHSKKLIIWVQFG